jgi:cyclic pyranopterin phosphate synthase
MGATASVGASGVVYTFESIDDDLPFMPLAARRTLDGVGRKLSLAGWHALSVEQRWSIALAGAGAKLAHDAVAIIDRAEPARDRIEVVTEASDAATPPEVSAALGPERPLQDSAWRALRPLDRYALVKSAAKPEKLARAYDEILGRGLPHLTPRGEAHMVDVAAKAVTRRRAVASARVKTTPRVIESIASAATSKGDVVAAARIAGILASKRTAELIPLCHPVSTTTAAIVLELDPVAGQVRVIATVEAMDRTGVEMEALVAASVAALTVYDMIKGSDRWASIESVRLEAKSGGRSGDVTRPAGGAGSDP